MVQAGHGQKPFCPCSGRGERLVSETPALVHPRSASPPVINDAGPLRLLRRWRVHSTIGMVRPSSGADMAEVAVSARSPKRRPMGAPQRNPETPSTASSPDCPRIHRRERISLVKNRMRQFRKSGSVRDEDGNVLIYSAMTPVWALGLLGSPSPQLHPSRSRLAIWRSAVSNPSVNRT